MHYNWQQQDWPNFTYDLTHLEAGLIKFAEGQGQIAGYIKGLPAGLEDQTIIDFMVAEAIKTSAIEGELLSREDVLSSIRNNLGLNRTPEKIMDQRAAGVAQLMISLRENFAAPLSEELLFSWHKMLMESYLNINKGQWRKGQEPMQVISGSIGKEVVHFEAPPAKQVPGEMKNFIKWFNATEPGQPSAIIHAPVRSAIAHVYFESIHPFEDGNGRMGRALSEKALSQGLGRPILLSLSRVIETKRQAYYDALKKAQRSTEITDWISYFLDTILEAQQQANQQIAFTFSKATFFDRLSGQLNPRQEKVLARMLEAGPEGFQGGMSAKKYMSIAKTSKATAHQGFTGIAKIGSPGHKRWRAKYSV